ncbi:MAG: hypothetical protein GX154_08715 [Clostridiales bacterium]|nr:hypothetical protein [Clostridiales bacterium]
MFYKNSIKICLALIIIFTFLTANIVSPVFGQPFEEIHERLTGITAEEKEVLSKLFLLSQEIEGMEKEEKNLTMDIDRFNQEIEDIKIAVSKNEKDFEKNKEGLKQVLKSYQRMGPGSYLEIILNSDSLADLLIRINTLQDITKNTGQLLNIIEKGKESLLKTKAELDEKLAGLSEKQVQLERALLDRSQLKEYMETYLISLKDEKGYYEEHLAILEKAWEEVGITVSNSIEELTRIVSEEDLPLDAVKLSFSFLKIKGTIEEKVFNDIIKAHPNLPKMQFKFTPGVMTLEMPDNNTNLKGKLIIPDGSSLEFIVEEGDFYGMPLESRSISELFKGNRLVLSLKPILEGNKLDTVEIKDGYIELTSTLSIFGRIGL